MDHIAEKWKIEAVLALVRATELRNFVIAGLGIAGSKTSLFMNKVGYSPQQVFQVMRELEVQNYSYGPLKDDKGREHDLWVFGTYVQALETYIKLVALVSKNSVVTTCVSFHEAERPLPHPYAEGGLA